jgi:hypothetical protein
MAVERRPPVAATVVAVAASLLVSTSAFAQDLGYSGDLAAGIPVPDAAFQHQSAIHEGGLHLSYVTTEAPEALPWAFKYRAELQAAGWTITDLGGGGNPFGSPGGALLTAEHADGRFLKVNAGHPGVQHLDHAPSVSTFIDACVWPQVPEDVSCNHLRVIDIAGDAASVVSHAGATGELTTGVPEPAEAEYRSDDALPEGGRHFHYISPRGHFELFQGYLATLHEAGWTISDATTSGDESGGSGSGTATDGGRHLVFSATGGGLVADFDACVWPQPPSEAHCPRNGND